jgi:hypothetical protein
MDICLIAIFLINIFMDFGEMVAQMSCSKNRQVATVLPMSNDEEDVDGGVCEGGSERASGDDDSRDVKKEAVSSEKNDIGIPKINSRRLQDVEHNVEEFDIF